MLNRIWSIVDKLKLWSVYDTIDIHYEYRAPRAMICELARRFSKDMTGAEIGTQRGVNAYSIMRLLPMDKLYIIDPYEFYDYEGRSQNAVDPDNMQNAFYVTAKHTLEKYGDRVEFILKKSEDAVDLIPDHLDFVYIDGNHDYPFIKKDIEMYYPKVRKGGLLGGHDIHLQDVFKAVSEFRADGDKKINIKRVDWWFEK